MRFRYKMCAVLAFVLMIALLVEAQTVPDTKTVFGGQPAIPEEEVFRKQLPDKSTLLVLRSPGVYAKEPPLFPGAIAIYPDRVDLLSLFLVPTDGKARRLLWKRSFLVYLTNPSKQKYFTRWPESKFYDASLEANRLVVLCQDRGTLIGEVVNLGTPAKAEDSQAVGVLTFDPTLSRRANVADVTTAHFEGPVVNGIPTIVATKITGEVCRYVWKDGKWFEPNPKPKAAPPAPVREEPKPVAPNPNAPYRREIILEKRPPGSHSMGEGLFVIRQLERPTTPSQPPSAAPSGDEIAQPKRADLYTMTFYKYGKETGWSERALWSMRLESYTDDKPDLQVLDAVYDEPESAAIVYRRGGALYADVLRLDSEAGRAGLPRADARLDVGKLAPGQAPLQAKLEGSLKTDSLAVVVKVADKSVRFNFKNSKWVVATGAS